MSVCLSVQFYTGNMVIVIKRCSLVELIFLSPVFQAILYYCNRSGGAGGAAGAADSDCTGSRLSIPSGVALVSPVTPPPLVVPLDQYPSVLVTETCSSSTVTIRLGAPGLEPATLHWDQQQID